MIWTSWPNSRTHSCDMGHWYIHWLSLMRNLRDLFQDIHSCDSALKREGLQQQNLNANRSNCTDQPRYWLRHCREALDITLACDHFNRAFAVDLSNYHNAHNWSWQPGCTLRHTFQEEGRLTAPSCAWRHDSLSMSTLSWFLFYLKGSITYTRQHQASRLKCKLAGRHLFMTNIRSQPSLYEYFFGASKRSLSWFCRL